MTQLLPPKKEVALALLERSNVDIYLDPRADGVVVPPQFKKPPLILKIGLNMPVPIPDLRLDDESMSCTLSFNRSKFFCVVPWLSVFAMVGDDGRGMVWPDDVPKELAVKVDDRGSPLGEAPAPASSRGGPRALKSVDPDAEPTPSERGRKRGKKKKDEPAARPMLVAVPSPPPSTPRLEKIAGADKAAKAASARNEAKDEGEESARDEKDKPAASPLRAPAARPAASGRPKRELPPYLRVVK